MDNKAMNRNYALLLILLALLLQASAWGDEAVAVPEVSYFADKQRGWFWYEVLPEPVLEKKPESEPPKPAPSQSETPEKQPKVEEPQSVKQNKFLQPNLRLCLQPGYAKTWRIISTRR